MPSRDINDLHSILQEFWPKLKNWYEGKFPNRIMFITCTYRSPAEQLEIYNRNSPGHILTRCDGTNTVSKHNHKPALAFDVAVKTVGGIEGPVVVWQDKYYQFGDAVKELGYSDIIRWGGWWQMKDLPHFEII